MNTSNVSIEGRIIGCLQGVAIGDVLGWPVENLSHAQIARIFPGRHVPGPLDAQHHKAITDHHALQMQMKWFKGLSAGDYTDDTQQTLLVARSLIECGGLNMLHQLHLHHLAFLRDNAGWGPTTKDGLLQRILAQTTHGTEGTPLGTRITSYRSGSGVGNGPAMKVAPLAIWHALEMSRRGRDLTSPDQLKGLATDVRNLAELTHSDRRAAAAAFAQASVICHLMTGHRLGETPFSQVTLDFLKSVVHTLNRLEPLGDLEYKHGRRAIYGETFGAANPESRTCITAGLNKLIRLFKKTKPTPDLLREELGCGGACWESIPFSIGMACLFPNDPRRAINETIMMGGDTDTNASMVGAIVGANVGAAWPAGWTNEIRATRTMRRLVHELIEADCQRTA